jgi:threonine/homoserine/homoserine lactone efflux protein
MTILSIVLHFCLGFITSFIGSIPLGSINATVMRISMTRTMGVAIQFIIGATIAELFYSFICVHFSGFLLTIPKLEFYIQLICIPVFIILGFTYWYAKPKPEEKTVLADYRTSTFLQGLSIGFLNPLQIPFWLAYTTYFLSVNWIRQDTALLNFFILGIISGSSLLLYLIAKFSSFFGQRVNVRDQTINRITAGIFFLLSFYQLIKVLIERF